MSVVEEDAQFIKDFNEFFDDKFKIDLVIASIKNKISREVDDTNKNVSKERGEISRKEETIEVLKKGVEFLIAERDSEKTSIAYTKWSNENIDAVESAITSIKTKIDADFRKIQSIKEKLLSLKETKLLSDVVCNEIIPSCSICFERYDKMDHSESALTVCGHKFGKSCIEKSFEKKKNCPNCDKAFEKANILVTYD
ncbi:unnamed protein product [Oikopleura dioica]|uniref:RING-type domain-containing protein n=1 Tax=Oikopleura dioica TaxID=34765 RepID=E4YHE5_OIKDI|nr:unnamed protein product [Oikopleura dioica]